MLLSAATTTRADASVVTPAPGQELTLLAVVASGSGTPTGTVTFYDGSTNLGTATLNGGIARLAVAGGLPLGTNNIQANYSGDSNFATSTGNLTLTAAAPANDVVTNDLDSVPQTAADQNAPLPDNTDQLVRYADGVVTIAQTDLSSSGFGFPWAQNISWSNGPGYANGVNGNGWVDTYMPHLMQADGPTNNTLVLVANGNTAYYFNLVNGVYQASLRRYVPAHLQQQQRHLHAHRHPGRSDRLQRLRSTWQPAQRGQFASYHRPRRHTDGRHLVHQRRPHRRDATLGPSAATPPPNRGCTATCPAAPTPDCSSNVTLRTQVNGGAWNDSPASRVHLLRRHATVRRQPRRPDDRHRRGRQRQPSAGHQLLPLLHAGCGQRLHAWTGIRLQPRLLPADDGGATRASAWAT